MFLEAKVGPVHTMKAYRGTEGIPVLQLQLQLPVFILTLLMGGGEWSVSYLGHVMFGERITGSHWLVDWLGGLQSCSGYFGEENNLVLTWNRTQGRPDHSLLIVPTELMQLHGISVLNKMVAIYVGVVLCLLLLKHSLSLEGVVLFWK